jgi:hypothetical protein
MKHVAATSPDPVAFAKELDDITNGLIEEGFTIGGMIERGDGLVVSSSRMEPISSSAPPPQGPPSSVTYYFTDTTTDGVRSCSFSSIAEAVKMVKEHLTKPEVFSPRMVVLCFVATFDPRLDMHLLEKLSAEA